MNEWSTIIAHLNLEVIEIYSHDVEDAVTHTANSKVTGSSLKRKLRGTLRNSPDTEVVEDANGLEDAIRKALSP